MSTTLAIYLIGIVDNIIKVIEAMSILGIAGLPVLLFFIINSDSREERILFRKCTKALIILLISLSPFLMFIPSSKTIAAMYIVPKIIENEKVSTELIEIKDLAKKWLYELNSDEKKK